MRIDYIKLIFFKDVIPYTALSVQSGVCLIEVFNNRQIIYFSVCIGLMEVSAELGLVTKGNIRH